MRGREGRLSDVRLVWGSELVRWRCAAAGAGSAARYLAVRGRVAAYSQTCVCDCVCRAVRAPIDGSSAAVGGRHACRHVGSARQALSRPAYAAGRSIARHCLLFFLTTFLPPKIFIHVNNFASANVDSQSFCLSFRFNTQHLVLIFFSSS